MPPKSKPKAASEPKKKKAPVVQVDDDMYQEPYKQIIRPYNQVAILEIKLK